MLKIKEALQKFYIENDYWAVPVTKAVTSLLCFLTVNSRVGYSDVLSNPFVSIIAAVLCSFLPWTCIPVFFGLFILGNAYAASLEMTVVAVIVLLLASLTHSAFRTGHSILIALVPLCFYIHIPYIIPLIAGLSLGIIAIVPVSIGVLLYYFMEYMSITTSVSDTVSNKDITAMATAYAGLFGNLFNDKELVITICVFAFCIIIVFIISQIAFDSNWSVAVIAGSISIAVSSVIGYMHYGLDFSFFSNILSLVISCIISLLYVFAFHAVDYQRTERLRFEDDDYIYYVKAVPKLKSEKEDED